MEIADLTNQEPVSAVSFEEKVSYWLNSNGYHVPVNWESHRLENLPDSDEKKVLLAYDDGNDEFGFLLLGQAGVGKTYALTALLNKILHNCHIYNTPMNLSAAYYPVGFLIYKLRSTRDPKEFQDCIKSTFLFLDDLGSENTTDFAREHFFTILDIRCQKKKPTFITSNLTINELKEKYGERLISRLKEMCAILNFTGPDRRTDIMKERIQELKLRMAQKHKNSMG